MHFQGACIAVLLLLLQVWGAVWGRPSEAGGAPELSANLLDRNTIFNACPRPPDVLSAPSELAGDWCGLQNSETTTQPASCTRLTVSPVGENLRAILNTVENGGITATKNITFSKITNDSWFARYDGRTTNLFIGLSADGKYLRVCGTTIMGDHTPTEVSNIAWARCLEAGEEALVATGERPNVEHCNLPQAA